MVKVKRKALLIGISEYGKGIPNLDVVPNDIEILQQSLAKSDFDVKTLSSPDQAPKKAEICEAIVEVAESSKKLETLILYFSGHGIHFQDEGQDYILTSQASVHNINNPKLREHYLFSPATLNELLADAKFKTIVVLVDACREGVKLSCEDETKGIVLSSWGNENQWRGSQSTVVMFACEKGKNSQYVKGKDGFSLFTKALAEVLDPDCPACTIEQVLAQTQEKLDQLVEEHNKKSQKIRWISCEQGADFDPMSQVICDGNSVDRGIETQSDRPSPMRSPVSDEHYIERTQAKRLLESFANALKEPEKQPLLFNIYGIGGVGKTTLLGRLKKAHAGEIDFLEVCFAKTDNARIEYPLKLMETLHQQATPLLAGKIIADPFAQQKQQFLTAIDELSQRSVDGERTSREEARKEEARKIIKWFQKDIWLGPKGLTYTSNKPKSFELSVAGFSALTAIEDDAESWQYSLDQRVRNHPATKDRPDLQELMLQPVSQLTQAFAQSLIQIAQQTNRSLVLVLDTYEKAQPSLNQWLWQHLVEDTTLSSNRVRLVVVGRRSLSTDEGWRKLNQDRDLLYEIELNKFSREDTIEYLKKIRIENGGDLSRIYKATKGLPYYLNWVRNQLERGNEIDFSQGNQAISDLLLQGLDSQKQKILQMLACCRYFDEPMIQYLLENYPLDLPQELDNAEKVLQWLKKSDFVALTNRKYHFDDVARDVFRQSYFNSDRNQFRRTHALLAEYFKQQADQLFDSQSLLPDPYEDEEWRQLIAESLYYSIFGKGKQGLQQYIEQVFVAVYLQAPDVFHIPFALISAEINQENKYLLPNATAKFFKDSALVLSLGWVFLDKEYQNYKIKFSIEGTNEVTNISFKKVPDELTKQIKASILSLLRYVDNLENGFAKCLGLIYQYLNCDSSRPKTDLLLNAKSQIEKLSTSCRPKLLYSLFSKLGNLLIQTKNYQCLQEATEIFDKAIALNPTSIFPWLYRGILLCLLKRYEEALESVDNAIELNSDFVYAWILRGLILDHLEAYEKSVKSYNKAIDLEPKSIHALMFLGNLLNQLKRYKEAVESYNKVIELDHKFIDHLVNKGYALNKLEQYEEALKSLDKAIALDAQCIEAWNNRRISLSNLERYEEALESAQKGIDIDSKFVDAWVNRGAALFYLQRYEEALESYNKAIDLDPESTAAWICKGNILRNKRQYQESLVACDEALKINAKSDNALNSQALTLSLLKYFEKAITAIDKAIELEPQQVLYQANRGIILARAGRYPEAIADCDRAIEQDPNHVGGYYAKACYYALQRKVEPAINNLQKAIDIAPRRSRSEAKHNPDFDRIRDDERFQDLLNPKSKS